jgi:hypothetical protein
MSISFNEQNKYVSLQMAAEAFLVNPAGDPPSGNFLIDAFVTGNTNTPASFQKKMRLISRNIGAYPLSKSIRIVLTSLRN